CVQTGVAIPALLERRLPPEDRAGSALLADQSQTSRAAREGLADQLLEVPRRRLVGLLESPLNLTIRVPDQGPKLAQRCLQIRPPGLELLGVAPRLRILLLGERIARPELLAPAPQPLHPAEQGPRLLLAERKALGLLLRGQPQAFDDCAQLELG